MDESPELLPPPAAPRPLNISRRARALPISAIAFRAVPIRLDISCSGTAVPVPAIVPIFGNAIASQSALESRHVNLDPILHGLAGPLAGQVRLEHGDHLLYRRADLLPQAGAAVVNDTLHHQAGIRVCLHRAIRAVMVEGNRQRVPRGIVQAQVRRAALAAGHALRRERVFLVLAVTAAALFAALVKPREAARL
jgi:hypothetical protein